MSTDISPGQFVISTDGTKIWAHACGDSTKPSVVFVHGYTCTADVFEKQYTDSKFLSNVYMIRYDVRGCGRSEVPSSEESYASERHAQDLQAVIDAFKVSKPFVAGWSLGGISVADRLALYGTDSVAGMILIGSFPWRSMHPEVVHPYFMGMVPGLLSDSVTEAAEVLPKFALSAVAPTSSLPYDVKCKWMGATAAVPVAVRKWLLLRGQDESALLKVKDTIPIMTILGKDDLHLIPDKYEPFMKKTFAKLEFHLLPGVGHSPYFENPEFTNEAVTKFVQKYA